MRDRAGIAGVMTGIAIAISGCSSSPTSPASSDAGASAFDDAGGVAPDAGVAAPDASVPNPYADGEPIEGGPDRWTWVSFPDSSCANGSPAGLGVSLGTTNRVLIYLEGGGACWDETTCFGPSPTAVRTTTAVSEADVPPMGGPTPFDRQRADNPFRAYSFVFVPYCTGDLHAGDAERTYGARSMKHTGRRNIEAFLHRLVPTFAGAERVVLSGTSAGGFGAYLNFDRVQTAFRGIPVDLIDDAGQPLPADIVVPMPVWRAAWDLDANFPADCAGCGASLDAPLAYYVNKYPSSRFALLSFASDPVIAGAMQLTAEQFTNGLSALLSASFDPHPNTKYFILPGSDHVVLYDIRRSVAGVRVADWLAAMQTPNEAWESVRP